MITFRFIFKLQNTSRSTKIYTYIYMWQLQSKTLFESLLLWLFCCCYAIPWIDIYPHFVVSAIWFFLFFCFCFHSFCVFVICKAIWQTNSIANNFTSVTCTDNLFQFFFVLFRNPMYVSDFVSQQDHFRMKFICIFLYLSK